MRALVLEDFGTMVVAERPRPEPAPGEALVAITATGICGSDLHGYTGETGRRQPGQIMGHETVGTLAALGPGTALPDVETGATVTFNPLVSCGRCRACAEGAEQHCPDHYVIGADPAHTAAFAQYVCVPAANIVALPPEMPVAYGALIEPFAVSLHAVRRAGIKPGDDVVITGGGPIGQSCMLAARLLGARRIIVSEPDPARRALIQRLGARTHDPLTGPVPEQVRRIFGRSADVALDAVGVRTTLDDALSATRLGGTVCLVGLGTPQLEFEAYKLSVHEHTLVGSFCYSRADFRDAAAWVSGAPAELAELISHEVPLAQAPETFARLVRESVPGKVLVYPGR
jgi:threonine dehydrogenase-like Zn-dependent dehydrogenase